MKDLHKPEKSNLSIILAEPEKGRETAKERARRVSKEKSKALTISGKRKLFLPEKGEETIKANDFVVWIYKGYRKHHRQSVSIYKTVSFFGGAYSKDGIKRILRKTKTIVHVPGVCVSNHYLSWGDMHDVDSFANKTDKQIKDIYEKRKKEHLKKAREESKHIKALKESKEKLSISLKDFYEKHPENRQKISKIAKKAWKVPGYKEKMSKALKKAWKVPGYKEKMSKALKKAFSGKEYRENISKRTKEHFKHPENRQKVSDFHKEMWKVPGYKEKMSKIAKKNTKESWKNPEIREKRIKGVKESWKNPEIREKRMNAHSQQEVRKRMKLKRAQAWKTAEYRQKVLKRSTTKLFFISYDDFYKKIRLQRKGKTLKSFSLKENSLELAILLALNARDQHLKSYPDPHYNPNRGLFEWE